MSSRHVVLLIEDDARIAEEVGDLLESLGYQHIHAENLAEALTYLEKGHFCLVLLDLEIKAVAESIRARITSGQTFMRECRARYPGRGPRDVHLLPILIVSSYGKDHEIVVASLRDGGADDFVKKPFSENRTPLDVRIRAALERAGRESHDNCALRMREAAGLPEASGAGGKATRVRLDIPGEAVGPRTVIAIGGKKINVREASLVLLLKLVVAKLRTKDGWAERETLGARDDQGWSGIRRLREDLKEDVPEGFELVANDRKGSYRLALEVEIGDLNLVVLAEHPSGRVKQQVALLREPRRQT